MMEDSNNERQTTQSLSRRIREGISQDSSAAWRNLGIDYIHNDHRIKLYSRRKFIMINFLLWILTISAAVVIGAIALGVVVAIIKGIMEGMNND